MNGKICFIFILTAFILAGLSSAGILAQEQKPSIAVLDFEEQNLKENLGSHVSDLVTTYFTALYPNYHLVERAKLKKILEEQELTLSGIVNSVQAAKVGKLCGAKILITGKIFTLGKQMMFISKIIGTETSKVKAVMVKDKLNADLDGMVQKLVKKTGDLLNKDAAYFIAKDEKVEVLANVKKALDGLKLPKVRILLPERHMGAAIPDPAARTELLLLMKKLGIIVLEGAEDKLAEWARKFAEDRRIDLPEELRDVDVIIVGHGFSQFALRKGNLVSCKARVEAEAIDVESQSVLAVGRKTGAAVDLAEFIAAKSALQRVARQLAPELITEFVKVWNEKQKKEKK